MHVQGGEKKKCKKSVAACAYVGYLKFFFCFRTVSFCGLRTVLSLLLRRGFRSFAKVIMCLVRVFRRGI